MTTRDTTHRLLSLLCFVLPLPLLFMLLGQNSCTEDNDGDGLSEMDGDCDDEDPTVYTGATEICDEKDNDCNNQTDEGLGDTYYPDRDHDGYGENMGETYTCAPSDGYVLNTGDCNDYNAKIYPGALELCDDKDTDCDGVVEGRRDQKYYRDADGDGFGSDTDYICGLAEGYIPVRGDCVDSSASYYPGADDPASDGHDQDCGGSTGPEVHVGLGASSMATIAEAIASSVEGRTIWVGPGTYLESELSFTGKNLKLMSTHFAADTIIDADGSNRVFHFSSGEDSSSLLDGFTITGGSVVGDGGGLLIEDSSPTIQKCIIQGNEAQGYADENTQFGGNGGGIAVITGSPTVSDSYIQENTAIEGSYDDGYLTVKSGGSGGGIYLKGSESVIGGVKIENNSASGTTAAGAGLFATQSIPDLNDSEILTNQALSASELGSGGGVFLELSDGRITSSIIQGNRAAFGGGVYLSFSDPDILDNAIIDNFCGGVGSWYQGGGLYLLVSNPRIASNLIAGNRADTGGGLFSETSSPEISNATFVSNSAGSGGGGIYMTGSTSSPILTNVIAVYNAGYNVFNSVSAPVSATITYSNFYSHSGPNHNLSGLDGSNVSEAPAFMIFSNDGVAANDDYHLLLNTSLIDTGNPAITDPDDTRSDFGAYGGPDANFDYYRDQDSDTIYDGWETHFGLTTAYCNCNYDTDGDQILDRDEFYIRTNPVDPDTDGDGAYDYAEIQGGNDPRDWFSKPTVTGVDIARVPEDFATIQEAIGAIKWEGEIEVGPGTQVESLFVGTKSATIRGRRGSLATAVLAESGRALVAIQSELNVEGLTITGGEAAFGGGVQLSWTEAKFDDVTVSGNEAEGTVFGSGGGVHASDSTLEAIDSSINGNIAKISGGGLALEYSSATLENSSISNNRAQVGGGVQVQDSSSFEASTTKFTGNSALSTLTYATGGAINQIGGSIVLSSSTFQANTTLGVYGYGGAVRISSSDATLSNCRFIENGVTGTSSTARGGAIHAAMSAITIDHSYFDSNSADGPGNGETGDGFGGAIYLSSGSGTLSNSILTQNSVSGPYSYGAAMYISDSSPTISNTVMTANRGTAYSGLYIFGVTSMPYIQGTVLAYNIPYNLFIDTTYTGTPIVAYCDVYNPVGAPNHNLSSLDTSNTTAEPEFLSYDQEGIPTEWHLSVQSPLIGAGSPTSHDPDGSATDMGAYGGAGGDGWDLDADAFNDYFWPGELTDAPDGYSVGDYDCDDWDDTVQECPPPE